uniref:Kazal-like domain-containing protein n=1 Tax=Phlebotomus papatasi TaxID=29031 RepID=A0A1B0DPA0_PHLPP
QEVDATIDDTVKPLCPSCIEPLIYTPICCIYPDGSTMTFSSYCSLQYYNCIHFTQCIAVALRSCDCLGIYPYPPIIIDPYPLPTSPIEEPAQS